MDAATFLLKQYGLESLSANVTARNAMGISTFFGCVKHISNVMASIPYTVYRDSGAEGSEKYYDHPAYYTLSTRFNENMSSFIARRALITNWLVYGWAVAEIKRDRLRNVVSIIPYASQDVTILHDDETDRYFFQIPSKRKNLSQDDVIFLRDLSFDGNVGHSIINWQCQTIKIDLLAKEFAQKYYEKGTFMGGMLETPDAGRDAEQAKIYKQRIIESLQGADGGGFGFTVLGPGVKWHNVGRPPVESQLMELFSKSSSDVAQMFNLPLSMIGDTSGDTSWGTGVEQMFIRVTNTVYAPIAAQIEQEFNYKCFRKDEILAGVFTRHIFKSFLRGDLKSQGEYYAKMVTNGIYTIDEVRGFDDMKPLPGGVGARSYMQGAMMPLDIIDEVRLAKQNKNGTGKEGTSAGTE